jgi:hypothetical protein
LLVHNKIYKLFHETGTYKQNKGSTKRNGKSNGIMNKDVPQVQVLPRISPNIVIRIVNDTMKQPPRARYCTKTVLPLYSSRLCAAVDDDAAAVLVDNGFPLT